MAFCSTYFVRVPKCIIASMTRPLRIEFEGALYHVTARGDRREAIYEDDEDRESFLSILGTVIEQFNWVCHAYCLMSNHYHLVIETPDGNLSKGMRQLNGVFTQASNRRYRRNGHLFQGRFKAILVDQNDYLLELTRYVVLNPVRAGMVGTANDWPWSSYRAMLGKGVAPSWLAVEALLSLFATHRAEARQRYQRFVAEGVGQESLWTELRQQIYLGNDAFIKRMQTKVEGVDEMTVPRAQRRPPAATIAAIAQRTQNRNVAIVEAYATGAYSYRQIGEYFGLHLVTVGGIVRAALKDNSSGVDQA